MQPSPHQRAHTAFARILALTVAAAAAPMVGCTPMSETAVEPTSAMKQTYSYTRDIQPILETRCIACHGCNDAPCQLKLTSTTGLLRGATKSTVYDSARVKDMTPTRLFVDAQNTAEWRQRGFYSVFNERGGPLAENLEYSLLFDMIELGREHPLAPNGTQRDQARARSQERVFHFRRFREEKRCLHRACRWRSRA